MFLKLRLNFFCPLFRGMQRRDCSADKVFCGTAHQFSHGCVAENYPVFFIEKDDTVLTVCNYITEFFLGFFQVVFCLFLPGDVIVDGDNFTVGCFVNVIFFPA